MALSGLGEEARELVCCSIFQNRLGGVGCAGPRLLMCDIMSDANLDLTAGGRHEWWRTTCCARVAST